MAEASTKRGRYDGVVLVAGDRGEYGQQNRFSGPTGLVGGPGAPLPGKVDLSPPVKQSPIDKYEGKKFLSMRHSEGSAGHKNGVLHQVCWFTGKWSGEGKLRLLDNWTYRGSFQTGG